MLALCAAPLAHAEDTLPYIVVESSRINTAAEIDPSQATGPVRIVDRNDFDNRTANLADVLGNQTGVQIRQSGGLGSASAISMRGSTSRQVQVLLDGMVLNDPVTGGVDLGKLALNDIQTIQVYPSGAPAQSAQAGIGGTIVLETMGKRLEDTTRIDLGAGSYDTYTTGLFRSGSHEEVYYWLTLDRQSSNNDFEYPNSRDWFNPNDGSTTKRRNADSSRMLSARNLAGSFPKPVRSTLSSSIAATNRGSRPSRTGATTMHLSITKPSAFNSIIASRGGWTARCIQAID